MLSDEQNNETHNVVSLAIIECFKIWSHFFEEVTITLLVLLDNKNLKKYIEATRSNSIQIYT